MCPLAKVQHLMALATDNGASSEEARTAAVLAIRLIRENNLLAAKKQPYEQLAEIRESAEQEAADFIKILKKKARKKQYPLLSAAQIVNMAVEMGEISPEEKDYFLKYFRKALRYYIDQGILGSIRGCEGGYYLVG